MSRPTPLPLWIVLGLVACLLPALGSADMALDLLKDAIRADGRVAYSATVEICTYRNGVQGPSNVQKIIHGTGNRSRVEVLAPARDAGRLIVNNGRVEWEHRPRANTVQERKMCPLAELQQVKLEQLELVKRTLHALFEGIDAVAGRKCNIIALRPPDGKVTRKRVWIDADTDVELKWERYDLSGKRTASWTVTKIDYNADIPAKTFSFRPPRGSKLWRMPAAVGMPLAVAEKKVGFRALVPKYLPRGYAFNRKHVGVSKQRGGKTALWMRFVNGVDSFSVFQSQKLSKQPAAAQRAMYWEADGFSFLLVGRLPKAQKAKVKRSIAP